MLFKMRLDGRNYEVEANLNGRHNTHTGLCLEPQVWPGSLEYPYFPQAILRPGDFYAQTSHFTFSRQ